MKQTQRINWKVALGLLLLLALVAGGFLLPSLLATLYDNNLEQHASRLDVDPVHLDSDSGLNMIQKLQIFAQQGGGTVLESGRLYTAEEAPDTDPGNAHGTISTPRPGFLLAALRNRDHTGQLVHGQQCVWPRFHSRLVCHPDG